MSAERLEAKAHELIGQLDPGKLPAVVHVLEVMVGDLEEDEEISDEEEAAVARSKAWFQNNGGIPFEQIVSELRFTIDQVRANAANDPAA